MYKSPYNFWFSSLDKDQNVDVLSVLQTIYMRPVIAVYSGMYDECKYSIIPYLLHDIIGLRV